MPGPTFIVIGGMKCGTTSLHHYLGQHPDIGTTRVKELDFFLDAGNWHRGREWYQSHFDEIAHFPVRGETSPNYSKVHLHPEVPGRIADLYPEVKLIYLVRHPIDRIVSMYRHMVADGIETRPFEEAVLGNADYVASSRYVRHVALYLEHFPRSQLLIVQSEHLDCRRIDALDRVFRFLGLRPIASHLDVSARVNSASARKVIKPWARTLVASSRYSKLLERSYRLRRLHQALLLEGAEVDVRPRQDVLAELARQLGDQIAGLSDLDPAFEPWSPD